MNSLVVQPSVLEEFSTMTLTDKHFYRVTSENVTLVFLYHLFCIKAVLVLR